MVSPYHPSTGARGRAEHRGGHSRCCSLRLELVPCRGPVADGHAATEVTQQSKARHKDDFVVAFSPVIGEATSTAYKGATSELQSKLRKVIAVWRDRAIFEAPIQDAIEKRIEGRFLFL